MSAVVGVLNESLTESIKGFYKLRKAYMTLDVILESENKYMRAHGTDSMMSSRRQSMESLNSHQSARSLKGMPGAFDGEESPLESKKSNPPGTIVSEPPKSIDDPGGTPHDDPDEAHDKSPTPATYTGHLDMHDLNGHIADLSISTKDHTDTPDNNTTLSLTKPAIPKRINNLMLLNHDPDSSVFANPLDTFIHSGANLCFGLLLLLISMIPPAFSKLLYIIGFRGDRSRGLRLLWQASKFDNINGAMAGLILLGWYNGLVGFCDIVPDSVPEDAEDVEGYPMQRLQALLNEMRIRYPRSQLWMLEEARMQAANRRLRNAVNTLSGTTKTPLTQVEALCMF